MEHSPRTRLAPDLLRWKARPGVSRPQTRCAFRKTRRFLMTDSDAAGLEARLKIVEDKLAIYELIASHPPSADTGSADYTSSVYLEDGVFDRGPTLDGATGVENIAAFTLRPAHEQAIRDGLAHFAGLPLIDLDGDRAVVTSYLMIIHLDHEGRPRELPNHGASQGYRIHRVVVNRWELERRNRRWRIAKRTLLPVDGSEPPLELLRRGLGAVIHKAASK